MGPLLDDLQRKMQQKVEQQDRDPLKLLVYSTHDTAVAGITNALDVFDHRFVLASESSHRLIALGADGQISQLA